MPDSLTKTEIKKLRRRLANTTQAINRNRRKIYALDGLVQRQTRLALQQSECLKAIARLTLAKT